MSFRASRDEPYEPYETSLTSLTGMSLTSLTGLTRLCRAVPYEYHGVGLTRLTELCLIVPYDLEDCALQYFFRALQKSDNRRLMSEFTPAQSTYAPQAIFGVFCLPTATDSV